MAEVVDLKAKRDERRLVWACNCGCTSHHHYADGGVECSSCGSPSAELSGEWRERLPPVPAEAEPLGADNFKVVGLDNAETWLRRRLKDCSDAVLLVMVDEDGAASTWSRGIDTPERRAWVERQMAAATARLLPPET